MGILCNCYALNFFALGTFSPLKTRSAPTFLPLLGHPYLGWNRLQEYKPVVALIYNQGVLKMEKNAREYFVSGEGIKGIIAAAFVVDSPFTSFMANFFVSVNKPKMPVRIFTNTEGALKWLQKFRK